MMIFHFVAWDVAWIGSCCTGLRQHWASGESRALSDSVDEREKERPG